MTAQPVRVWAPSAETVELVAPGADRSAVMTDDGAGWWRGPALAPGTDYAFRIDGGQLLPDPRSPWQPAGVHAPSRTFDASSFRWPAGWAGRAARGAVHYELHLGTFTPGGTLDSAIDRIGHLADLGVEMIELMPVAPFDGDRGWGYDGVSLHAVHEAYGGPAALQRFVAAAHAAGIGVCLDVVYNHLGPAGNYLAEFGPYFTDRHTTPWGDAVNLDGPDSGPVRALIVDSALRWFTDFGIDALRLDAIHALVDDSEVHLLAELAARTAELSAQLGRPLSLVAESDLNQPSVVLPRAQGGLGMDAQWADDVHHALHTLMTGEQHGYYVDFGTLDALAKTMTEVFVHDGGHSTFRGMDWGAPVPPSLPGHAFVVSAQNHDQVGNRALGDRPSRVLTDGQLAIEAAVLLAGPYTPMLFMGEEWGARTPFQFFTSFPDLDLAAAVRAGRTDEFGSHGWEALYGGRIEVPDPQAVATFEASRLDWSERDTPRGERLLAWYRQLIRVRREVADIADDDRARTRVVHRADDESWFVLHRGDVVVAVNLSDAAQEIPLADADQRAVLLAWNPVELGTDAVRLPGHNVAILGPAG
ncbi:MAG: malto-oligosyltrehalose trehalohydrolase [Candidatus Nanopelagicales bacterium]